MTDTNRRTEKTEENQKPYSQDVVGLVCIVTGGFFAVSAVQALRGQEPKLALLARPVLGLVDLIGPLPALLFCAGLAVLGCRMFLRSELVDVWRPLGLAGGVAFGLSFLLSGFSPDAGGALGAALPSALGGVLGKLLGALVGGLCVLVTVWWGILAPSGNFVKPRNFEGIERPEEPESTDGVTAAEAAFLVAEPAEQAAVRPAPAGRKKAAAADPAPDEGALPFGTRPLSPDEPPEITEEAAPARAPLDAERVGELEAEPDRHSDAGVEPLGPDLAEARSGGGESREPAAVPAEEVRALEDHVSPVLPSWARAEEEGFDEYGVGEPQPYEPPASEEEAAEDEAAEVLSAQVEVEETEEAEEAEDELAEEPEELAELEEHEQDEAEEDEPEYEEPAALGESPVTAPWEEEEVPQQEVPQEVPQEILGQAPPVLPEPEVVDAAAEKVDEVSNGAVVRPLETASAPTSPAWEEGLEDSEEEPEVEVKPAAMTGAPPATGVRQESLFEEVDLEEEEEEDVVEASDAADEDEEYEEAAEADEEEAEVEASADGEGDDEWEWEYEYEEEEEEEPEGAVASVADEDEDEEEYEYEDEEGGEASYDEDEEEGDVEEAAEEEEELSEVQAGAETPTEAPDEPEVVLQPVEAHEPEVAPVRLRDDVDQLVYDSGLLILDQGRVAVSMLQRKFTIDFDRACEVLDRLQELGLIGPYLGGRKREVLLSREEWAERVTQSA